MQIPSRWKKTRRTMKAVLSTPKPLSYRQLNCGLSFLTIYDSLRWFIAVLLTKGNCWIASRLSTTLNYGAPNAAWSRLKTLSRQLHKSDLIRAAFILSSLRSDWVLLIVVEAYCFSKPINPFKADNDVDSSWPMKSLCWTCWTSKTPKRNVRRDIADHPLKEKRPLIQRAFFV